MPWEYYYWQCCSNIFLEDCPQGSSFFNPHPPLFLLRFLLSFWQPIIFQPLSSFPPSSQLKLNKHFLKAFHCFSPTEGPPCEGAVWGCSGKVLLLGGCWSLAWRAVCLSVCLGGCTRLLCSSLRCAQWGKTSKNPCSSKHQPSSPSCFTSKSGIAKRRFWGILVLLLLATASLKPRLDLDQHRAQGCPSLPVSHAQNKATAMLRGEEFLFAIPYGFTLLFIPLPFSQQINTNKTKASLIKFNTLSQGWEVPGCRHCCSHWQLCYGDYY